MTLNKALIVFCVILITGCAEDVSIYTIPSGSNITINNREYVTPADIKLKEGSYSVKAELDGYESEAFDITVNRENVRFSHYLTPKKVEFELDIYPVDSVVYLGSKKLTKGVNLVVPGSYKLKAAKPLYRTVEEDVVIDLNTDYSKAITLEQSKKVSVNFNFSDPALIDLEPDEYSSIEFFSGGKGYTARDIDELKLDLGKSHEIEVKESGVTLEKYYIPGEENELVIEIESFNEASYIVEKVLSSKEEIDYKSAFKRLFVLEGVENSLSTQYYNYFNSLLKEYNYDILLLLLEKGSYDTLDDTDLYEPLLNRDDLEMFILLEKAGAQKLPGLMASIIKNKAYRCLEHTLKNMSKEEINSTIKYDAQDDFRGGSTYLIFLSQNDPKAFEMFIEHGARTDVKKVMKFYDFENPGTIIKTTTIEINEGLGKFNETEERKDFK